MHATAPTELRYRRDRRELVIAWDGEQHILGAEFLRVNSPSAEVQGHGGEGGTLPLNKAEVAITAIEPVGNYAVRIRFSDGHDTGLYSWDWLAHLCQNRDRLWQDYVDRRSALQAKASAAGNGQAIQFTPGK